MNYNQVLQYIVQWIYENHANKITGDILQGVLIEMLQYVKANDDNFDIGIQNLQNQIDNITISQNLNVFEGIDNPNVTPPTDPYDAPDIFVKTDTDDLFIFSGAEWVQITNQPEINSVLTEFRIDNLGADTDTAVVNYINNLTPPYNKNGNENIVITLYENDEQIKTFWLVGAGKGLYGAGQNQISVDNLVSFVGNGSGGGGIPDAPNDGKTYGRKSEAWTEITDSIETSNTSDIELSGDGTDTNPLEATLQPTPNPTDIFGRTDDHWQPVVRRMEEDGVRWVEVLSPNGEKLLQYSTEYFDEVSQSWRSSINILVNTDFDVKTLKGQLYVNALGYQAAQGSQGDNINAIGYAAAQATSGNYINALGYAAARGSLGRYINAIGLDAGSNSEGGYINAIGRQAGRNAKGDYINAIGQNAARGSQGDDINVFGRNSYSSAENPKCDRVNIFGPDIQPTKSDQNIISGHEFLMPLSTPATVLAAGSKSLTTLETVEEIVSIRHAIITVTDDEVEEEVYHGISYIDEDSTITEIRAVVTEAPTGQSLIVLVRKNGSTIATLTIPANSRVSNPATSLNVDEGDIIDFEVTQIGSIDPGMKLQFNAKIKNR